MKKFTFFVCCIFSITVYAQHWNWAKNPYGTGDQYNTRSIADHEGNLYVAGQYRDSLLFGSSTMLYYLDGYDMFLAKYDSSGNLLWAQSFYSGSPNSITSDSYGNTYLAGYFGGSSITFGTFTLIKDTLYGGNMFLAKFDPNGNILWAIQAGGNSIEYINSSSSDAIGNTYITGVFHSPTITLGTTTLYNSGWIYNIFTAKVDPTGNVVWAKGIGSYHNATSSSYVSSSHISNDLAGNVYVTGYFTDSIAIIENDTLINYGGYKQLFIVKYDSNGNKQWSQIAGDNCICASLTNDLSGNLYMAGSFRNPTVTFGSFTLNGSSTTQYGEMYIVKFAPDGSVLWAKSSDGYYVDHNPTALKSDNAGNVYLVGYHGHGIIFGSDTLNKTMDPPYTCNMFIVGYSSNGALLFSRGLGAEGMDVAESVSPDLYGNLFITGSFSSDSISLDSIVLRNSKISLYNYNNERDIFVAKLNVNSLNTGINDKYIGHEISIYPNPSSGSFRIKLNYKSESTTAIVYDVLGNCVWYDCFRNDTGLKIDLSCQPKGVYFIEIRSEDKRLMKKVVLQQ